MSLRTRISFLVLALSTLTAAANAAPKIVTVDPTPLVDVVHQHIQPLQPSAEQKLYVITWGGDVATLLAVQDGTFKKNGLGDIQLVCENDFKKQTESFLRGETPYLRGTLGMINQAQEAAVANGTELVVIYQMTYSTGGDVFVARDKVKSAADMRGKTLGLQLYGPHADLAANFFTSAGVSLKDVHFKWFSDLSLPTKDQPTITDAVSAFRADSSLDGIMCISPDGSALTSGGTVGTGAEQSSKGSHEVFTTKTAGAIIPDVYVTTRAYLDAHRDKVQAFVSSLMQAQESLKDLVANKANEQARYQKLLSTSGDLLLGSSQATADVEGLLGDCTFVGYNGNVEFFTGAGTTRTLDTIDAEIQTSFLDMGLMHHRVPIRSAGWDYSSLAKGLKYATAAAPLQKFDTTVVSKRVEAQIEAEPSAWQTDGTLFEIEVTFGPNDSDFTADRYAVDFEKALALSQTYSGALVTIEGNSDPLGIQRAHAAADKRALEIEGMKKDGTDPSKIKDAQDDLDKKSQEIKQMEKNAKNLSFDRANAVKAAYLNYCKLKGITVDESQFVPVGMGIKTPKFPIPHDEAEWKANRRVVFRIKQVEAELTTFAPPAAK